MNDNQCMNLRYYVSFMPHCLAQLQVDNTWRSGDVRGARESSRMAKRLNIAALLVGLCVILITVIVTPATRACSGPLSE